jgi:hypothetical protein
VRALIPAGTLLIKTILRSENLSDYISTTVATTRQNLTSSIIMQALSDNIVANLFPRAADTNHPRPVILWNELKLNYSAISGAGKAVLFQLLLKTWVPDQVGQIKSAHTQINQPLTAS